MVVELGHFMIKFIFLFIGLYTLGRANVPPVCDLSVEELAFWGFEFKSGLLQLLEHGIQPHKIVSWVFWEDDNIIEVYTSVKVDVLRTGFHQPLKGGRGIGQSKRHSAHS